MADSCRKKVGHIGMAFGHDAMTANDQRIDIANIGQLTVALQDDIEEAKMFLPSKAFPICKLQNLFVYLQFERMMKGSLGTDREQ